MKIVEVRHPLVKHKLGLMREHDISTKRFRELASEVGSLLTYEATADLETERVTIEGWNGPVEIDQIKGKKITVVPILRAGLGMMEGVLEHVPSARISVVGVYRDEETLEPVPYFQKLVSNIEERLALVVDPMLATGGSMIATVDLLKKAGCTSIKVLVLVAAPEGIAALEKAHPDVELYTASVDQGLNEKGYIIPRARRCRGQNFRNQIKRTADQTVGFFLAKNTPRIRPAARRTGVPAAVPEARIVGEKIRG